MIDYEFRVDSLKFYFLAIIFKILSQIADNQLFTDIIFIKLLNLFFLDRLLI